MRKVTLALAAFGTALVAATPAQARDARCVIHNNGDLTYQGPCDFRAERGGSFSIEPSDGGSFSDQLSLITVTLFNRVHAEVRGLTTDGVNSNWGEAERSPRDPACWVGDDFSVCAY